MFVIPIMAINEEELAIIVEKYSVLYDKSHKEFHRKDVKRNAWDAVASDMGLECGKLIDLSNL